MNQEQEPLYPTGVIATRFRSRSSVWVQDTQPKVDTRYKACFISRQVQGTDLSPETEHKNHPSYSEAALPK